MGYLSFAHGHTWYGTEGRFVTTFLHVVTWKESNFSMYPPFQPSFFHFLLQYLYHLIGCDGRRPVFNSDMNPHHSPSPLTLTHSQCSVDEGPIIIEGVIIEGVQL